MLGPSLRTVCGRDGTTGRRDVSYIVTSGCGQPPSSDSPPSVTALRYKDSLNLAVGTSTGQVLLYDLRAARPHLVKDHYYGFPIHSVSFQKGEGLVLSADSRILKIWHEKDVRSLNCSNRTVRTLTVCFCRAQLSLL